MNKQKSLNRLRKKIDSIDRKILGLLKKRSFIIPKVKVIKTDAKFYIRFKREEEMAYKFKDADIGHYNKLLSQKIWREIIAGTLQIECSLTIGVYKTEKLHDTWELSKDHFGVCSKYVVYEDLTRLLEDVNNKKIDAAILPYFDCESKWVYNLENYQNLRINLVLPFIDQIQTLNNEKAVIISLNDVDFSNHNTFYLVKKDSECNLENSKIINSNDKYNLVCITKKDIINDSNVIYLGSSPNKISEVL